MGRLAARKEASRVGCLLLGAAWVWILALSALAKEEDVDAALVSLGKREGMLRITALEKAMAQVLLAQPVFWSIASIGVAFSKDIQACRVILSVQTIMSGFVLVQIIRFTGVDGEPEEAMMKVALGSVFMGVAGSLCLLLDALQTLCPPSAGNKQDDKKTK